MIKKLVSVLKAQQNYSIKSQGTSMLPILQPDDVLYFKRINYNRIRLNDFILVKKLDKTFTHRVIYKSGKYLITKGDNNLTSDGKIYPRQVLGKVYQVKRNDNIFIPDNLYLIQSSLYFAEIIKIKKALEKEKIEFVFLKGLPLHLYFEGSHPRRIYADCDVLINSKDFNTVNTILTRCGYPKTDTSYSDFHKRLKDKPTEVMFIKKLNGFSVIFDVHFEANFLMNQLGKLDALYPQKLIDKFTEECLADNQQVTINNQQFPILSSSNLIIYLALHFFHHNFRGIYRLEFLDKVLGNYYRSNLSRTTSQFASLSRRINIYKLQNFIYPVFVLLRKLYKTPIPDAFLQSIQPSSFSLLYLSSIIHHPSSIFYDEPRIKAGLTRFQNLFFLSPNPLWRKILVFTNPQVIYSILWVLTKRLKRNLHAIIFP